MIEPDRFITKKFDVMACNTYTGKTVWAPIVNGCFVSTKQGRNKYFKTEEAAWTFILKKQGVPASEIHTAVFKRLRGIA